MIPFIALKTLHAPFSDDFTRFTTRNINDLSFFEWVDKERYHKNKKHNNPPALALIIHRNLYTHKTTGKHL